MSTSTTTSVLAGLEFTRAGAPDGFPVLLHHGLAGSAYVDPDAAEVAAGHGLDVISVARPGYGRSEPVVMESISQWHTLVEPLLDALGVDRYAVWGISAGAPYSYSLAAAHPQRVAAVAITSGLGHIADPRVVEMYDDQSRQAFAYFRDSDPDAVREYWQQSMSTSLAAQEPGSKWHDLLVSSLAHECAGPGREAVLQQRPWGFTFTDIVAPVRLWHSREDPMVPFATAEAIRDALPGAELRIQQSPEHLVSEQSTAEAMDFLKAVSKIV